MRLLALVGSTTFVAIALACGGGGGGGGLCPADASTASGFASGEAVEILALHPDDAYYGSMSLPVSGWVDGDLHNNGDCWFGGGFVAQDGTDYYFYKAAVKPTTLAGGPPPAADPVSCPSDAIRDAEVADGARLVFLGTHNDDAYHNSGLVAAGTAGRVDGGLNNNGECWFGGGFVGDDGTEYYFYKAAFRRE